MTLLACRPWRSLLLVALGLASACAHVRTSDPTLDAIDRLVRERFFDPTRLEAVGWSARVEAARARIASAGPAERERQLSELVSSLRASHTAYLPRSRPEYWELASIVELGLRENLTCRDPAATRPFPVERVGIGVLWREQEGRRFVAAVLAAGPAEKAGLATGDEVVEADRSPFQPVASFEGRDGRPVRLEVRRSREGPLAPVEVVPRREQPRIAFRDDELASARIIERGSARVGYVRVLSWLGEETQDALRAAISKLNAAHPTGFVVDIRNGWGGARKWYLSIFDQRIPRTSSHDRDGKEEVSDPVIRVPAVLLVNGGTRSSKETIAYAAKKARLATLVGERTAGAYLGGTLFCLPDGSLLYLAVTNPRIEGEALEGKGVEPDVLVPFDIRWAGGADPQLERALDILRGAAR